MESGPPGPATCERHWFSFLIESLMHRACGANVEVAEDNPKLQYLLQLSPIPDEKRYAEQVLDSRPFRTCVLACF